jgi:hypothetical protein
MKKEKRKKTLRELNLEAALDIHFTLYHFCWISGYGIGGIVVGKGGPALDEISG